MEANVAPSPAALLLPPALLSPPDGSWRHVCGSAASSHVNRRVSPPAACQNPLNLSLLGFTSAACKVLAKVLREREKEKPQADGGRRGEARSWCSVGVSGGSTASLKPLQPPPVGLWRITAAELCRRAEKARLRSSPAGSQRPLGAKTPKSCS